MKAFIIIKGLAYLTAGIAIPTAAALDSYRDQVSFVGPNLPVPASSSFPKVITPTVSAFVENALIRSSIPGISMGVVRFNSSHQPVVELAAWGRQTEEGDGNNLSPKVRLYHSLSQVH